VVSSTRLFVLLVLLEIRSGGIEESCEAGVVVSGLRRVLRLGAKFSMSAIAIGTGREDNGAGNER
jgi:hypothetical protein